MNISVSAASFSSPPWKPARASMMITGFGLQLATHSRIVPEPGSGAGSFSQPPQMMRFRPSSKFNRSKRSVTIGIGFSRSSTRTGRCCTARSANGIPLATQCASFVTTVVLPDPESPVINVTEPAMIKPSTTNSRCWSAKAWIGRTSATRMVCGASVSDGSEAIFGASS